MVRIIPSRLKPSSGNSGSNSNANSRSTSPFRYRGDSTSPDARKDPELLLNVVIIKARNLAAKDRGGTSDPYLVLTLGDAKHVTHSVPKSLNPEWNEVCQLPIYGIPSLVLDVCCWDKDRFGKDYLGEFDLALEEIFINDETEQEARWFPLRSKRPGKKTSIVSGEVLLQFTLLDASDKKDSDQQILEKFSNLVNSAADTDFGTRATVPKPSAPAAKLGKFGSSLAISSSAGTRQPMAGDDENYEDEDEDDEDEDAFDDELVAEDEDMSKPEAAEKRKRRLRIKGLKRKRRNNPYEFSNSGNDVLGIVFLEIKNITDLPPESNFTKTSFDMDPFVVASLGRKTFRTKTIHHNLNPVFNEKMIFQVTSSEQSYSLLFTVIDRDKYSGNDFIASTSLPIKEFIDKAPRADPETGLYELPSPPEYVLTSQRGRFKRLGISRSSSAQSLVKMGRLGKGTTSTSQTPPAVFTNSGPTPAEHQIPPIRGIAEAPAPSNEPDTISSSLPLPTIGTPECTDRDRPSNSYTANSSSVGSNENASSKPANTAMAAGDAAADSVEQDFNTFPLSLRMKNMDKWEDKHNPQLFIRAKYMPYPALRQQFWRAMLKQYDTDESGLISKVELSTMLDTLGSTLRESTIDGFFQRFAKTLEKEDDVGDLTVDEAVICLEDQLEVKSRPKATEQLAIERAEKLLSVPSQSDTPTGQDVTSNTVLQTQATGTPAPETPSPVSGLTAMSATATALGNEEEALGRDDLNDRGEEHVVEIRECPICHQPRLNKRKDADIITHIATCASQDWRQVNDLVMAGFVTSSQAQRKWYSKVLTKISYGGYRIGANSANILVQDRVTGQINEEKMSVYVRLGIRLLYKGLRSNNMENKRIRKLLKGLSIKQGKKYDDPETKAEIQKFIDFHQLDMSEVLLPLEEFKSFNEFFYRALKPGSRPCSAPNNPNIIVSPADCRSVVFNHIEKATKIWIKGREFSIKRLLGADGTENTSRFENGSLGIFRLAPQDYHRFHVPVDGVLGRPRLISGEYYTVNPMAIRSALDVYGENVRVIVPIDSDIHGRVIVVCVGAMMVGSTVITRQEGERVRRAEELGYFKFGGSTVVLLFEEDQMKFDDDLVENSNGALETLIRVGMSVGHSPNEPQWKADMPKDEREVTEQEKLEARRRIQGNTMTEDNSPEDSSGSDDLPTR